MLSWEEFLDYVFTSPYPARSPTSRCLVCFIIPRFCFCLFLFFIFSYGFFSLKNCLKEIVFFWSTKKLQLSLPVMLKKFVVRYFLEPGALIRNPKERSKTKYILSSLFFNWKKIKCELNCPSEIKSVKFHKRWIF